MSAAIRHPKDFWIGVIFIVIGLGAVFTRGDLNMGTSSRMGPAFFPVVLGILLALIGAAGVLRSFFRHGEPMEKLHLRPLALVTLAVILFGILMRGAGLVPAAVALVLVSAYAPPQVQLEGSGTAGRRPGRLCLPAVHQDARLADPRARSLARFLRGGHGNSEQPGAGL
jgi:putative tricarboxylic transport membrane protein